MKLNAAEKKWIEDLQDLLDACPSKRLGFFTIGDRDITVYDLAKERKINDIQTSNDRMDFGSAVEAAGAEIAGGTVRLRFPACVHSVAG